MQYLFFIVDIITNTLHTMDSVLCTVSLCGEEATCCLIHDKPTCEEHREYWADEATLSALADEVPPDSDEMSRHERARRWEGEFGYAGMR